MMEEHRLRESHCNRCCQRKDDRLALMVGVKRDISFCLEVLAYFLSYYFFGGWGLFIIICLWVIFTMEPYLKIILDKDKRYFSRYRALFRDGLESKDGDE